MRAYRSCHARSLGERSLLLIEDLARNARTSLLVNNGDPATPLCASIREQLVKLSDLWCSRIDPRVENRLLGYCRVCFPLGGTKSLFATTRSARGHRLWLPITWPK